jgi:hypothetical protein
MNYTKQQRMESIRKIKDSIDYSKFDIHFSLLENVNDFN